MTDSEFRRLSNDCTEATELYVFQAKRTCEMLGAALRPHPLEMDVRHELHVQRVREYEAHLRLQEIRQVLFDLAKDGYSGINPPLPE